MNEDLDLNDATRCPLCGGDNECAVAAGRSVETCWCMNASIDSGVLGSIPKEAQGRVCICARCAAAQDDVTD
jgi:hypothetical protein